MRRNHLNTPRIARFTLRLFGAYARWYMRRNLHAVRVSTKTPPRLDGLPIIVCLNHPSWWDPMVAMTLALRLYPERRHYAPMDGASLARYGFFERIGFFGVDRQTASGAAKFLRIGDAVLSNPRGMLWVTAQGMFSDARIRPVQLESGIGRLAHRSSAVAVLPVAIEYVFWEERFPEALVRFGEPVLVAEQQRTPDEWTKTFADALQSTQDALAVDAISRNVEAFETLVGGRFGVGGLYDLWRWTRAKLRKEPFHRAHGTEHL